MALPQPELESPSNIESKIIFFHPLQEEQNREIEKCVETITNQILSGDLNPHGIFGVMGAGKTKALKGVINNLVEAQLPIKVYRLNDGRAPIGEMFDRNGTELTTTVDIFESESGLGDICAEIELFNYHDMVICISEPQFGGGLMSIDNLFDIAKKRNITLIFDCLDRLYNGSRIEVTEYIRKTAQKFGNEHNLKPCDTFDNERTGDIPARFVAVSEEGLILDTIDIWKSHYYARMQPEDLAAIVKRHKESSDPRMRKLVRVVDGETYYLLPSHPTFDESYIPGGDERYKSTNFHTILEILEILELHEMASKYRKKYYSNLEA